MSRLTMQRLKNTNFPEFYKKFIVSERFTEEEKLKFLEIAIILMNTDNDILNKLGYRMILKYANKFKNYIPLFDISINSGFIPIAKFLEKNNFIETKDKNFFFQYMSSFEENFRRDNLYLTEEQFELYNFFKEYNKSTVAVVAPTSYGKSELILSCIDTNPDNNICIIVPTKSLLAQTRRRILSNSEYNKKRKIITHPEMYLETDENFVAVLTQERLLRLLQNDDKLFFDYVIIDEAHNLLSNDPRAKLLASALIILNHRNENTILKFLTPFILNTNNLSVKFTNYKLVDYKVKENIKSENYYYCDFTSNSKLNLYDQFLNEHYKISDKIYSSDIHLIKEKSTDKNILYLNKPVNIENVAKKFLKDKDDIDNDKINKAIKDIAKYVHNDYLLIECLKKGYVYHHGSVPDNIRLYLEHLFSIIPEIKYIITSSTLLEGVNIPADTIFLLEKRKGRSNLSHAQFKNLVGRISRFGNIFNKDKGSLLKLEPNIYLIKSEYMGSRENIKSYLEENARIDRKYKDDIENVLLNNIHVNRENELEYLDTIEFVENQQPGSIEGEKILIASTEVGQVCFKNSISEFDILDNEKQMQNKINELRNENVLINNTKDILEYMAELFISKVENNDFNGLKRLTQSSARRFYNMFLTWKIKQASYNEMISYFIRYWEKIKSSQSDTLVYVGKWGDEIRVNEYDENTGFRELWTDISKKSISEMINLAIVRIKEEQDFVDYVLMKFIEALYDLELLDENLYFKLKYGSDDDNIITIIKNGIGLQTAKLILDKYREYISIDIINNTIDVNEQIIDEMKYNDENEIVIYEIAYCIGK